MLQIIFMSKIVTITFSPCIDKSASVAALIPSKKLHCTVPVMEPGGGGINVARAIKKLGGEATAVFPIGGYTGKTFLHLLELENINSVVIDTVNETRENIIIVDESTHSQYRFGMPGTALLPTEWPQVIAAVDSMKDAAYIIASGSLPPGVPLNVYAQLARIAKKNHAKFIVDTSGEPLKHAAIEGVYLLKPNLAELSALAGKKELKEDEIQFAALDILHKGHCEAMVVSIGGKGALLVTATHIELITPPPVITKSTVGAGDSMVAGLVFALANKEGLTEAVKFGVACGTAATLNPGTALCNKADAERIFRLLQVNRL